MSVWEAIGYFTLQFFLAYAATAGFAILFSVPKGELLYSGFSGACGWLTYKMIDKLVPDVGVTAVFFAAMMITLISRILAYRRRMPQSVYLIGGIIPLVPGTAIYQTMYAGVTGDVMEVLTKGIDTIKIAGAIALGIIAVLSLPWKWFLFFQKPIDKTVK